MCLKTPAVLVTALKHLHFFVPEEFLFKCQEELLIPGWQRPCVKLLARFAPPRPLAGTGGYGLAPVSKLWGAPPALQLDQNTEI